MILPIIDDPVQKRRLDGLAPDGISVFMLEGDSIRGALVSGTRMVSLMRVAHGLGVLETMVLGQAYIAAALLSATIKGEDRIAIHVEGQSSRGYSVECTASGTVRGRLFSVPFDLDAVPNALEAGDLVGPGKISLTRYQAGRTEPVTGTSVARTGRLAEDLAYYYHVSEQVRTSFTLGVHFDADGRVAGAGGLYLQALPFASDEVLDRVERLVYGMPALGRTFATGAARMDIALRSFPFFDLNLLDDGPVEFACPCERERLGSFIAALPEDEFSSMAAEGPFPVEVRCQNCGSVYRYSQQDLAMMEGKRKASNSEA